MASFSADLHELHRLARHVVSRYGFARLTDVVELASISVLVLGVAVVGAGVVG